MWPTLEGGEHGEVDSILQVVRNLLAFLVDAAHALAVKNESGPVNRKYGAAALPALLNGVP